MNINIRLALLFKALIFLVILSSCDSDDPVATSVGFSQSSLVVSENSGTNQVSINFDANTADSTDISFSLGGFAALNGDYRINMASPVTVGPGFSTFNLEIEIIDEELIESFNDTVSITITNAEDLQIPSETSSFDLIITDNDVAPNDGVQFDLEWFLGEGVDIDQVNLDLGLAINVEIENNTITNADIITDPIGANQSGFESFVLSNDAPDDEYFIVVNYTEGSQAVNFAFILNGGGFNDNFGTDSFDSSEEGFSIFFGPITKSGTSFSARRSTSEFRNIGKLPLSSIGK